MEFPHKQAAIDEEIRQLQDRITGLRFHKPHQAVSTGDLIPGCEICVRKGYLSFQIGFACNARCPFCFLDTHPADEPDEDEVYHRRALLKRFHRHVEELEGVALTGGEPLLYLEELQACVREMRTAKPSLHFWVYTNGILADEEHLRALQDLGIGEIRFNLAATDYSAKTLRGLALARELIDHIAVEVPCYPPQKDALMACLSEIDRIGIDQLNLQELWITPSNVERLSGEGYQTGVLSARKFFLYGSRRMTYEVMERCVAEGYSFTVNDCTAGEFGRG
jgi:pyruvate formate-lyase activating enzyme-like uncharacterized protein